MKKISLDPFNLSQLNNPNKEIFTTPRLLSRHQKNIPYMDKLRQNKKQIVQSEQTFHFDDTFCFRDKKRQLSMNRQQKEQSKKCASQIMMVKISDGNQPSTPKKQCFQRSSPKLQQSGKQQKIILNSFGQLEKDKVTTFRTNRNHTSYSVNKKYQTIKVHPSNNFMASGERANSQNKSTFVGNSPFSSESGSPLKARSKQKYFWQFSATEGVKTQRPRDCLPNHKKVNFYQYSIIKPDEIKSLALIQRKQDKEFLNLKRKQQRVVYLQTMNQLKKKQELRKRNARLKQQIMSNKKNGKKIENRTQVYSAYDKGRKCLSIQEKEEVKPWDVEINVTNTNFTDMM